MSLIFFFLCRSGHIRVPKQWNGGHFIYQSVVRLLLSPTKFEADFQEGVKISVASQKPLWQQSLKKFKAMVTKQIIFCLSIIRNWFPLFSMNQGVSIQFFGDHTDVFNHLKSDFFLVRSVQNFPSDWLWIEVCQNAVFKKNRYHYDNNKQKTMR